MMKLWKYILPLIAVVVFASCSSKNEAEVIPRAKMADIYMEMFMTDQWISDTPGMRLIADTSLVYEPILAKYGYDKLDYIHSVDFYMNDPERFARILRVSMDKIDKRISNLHKIQKEQKRAEEAAKRIELFKMDHSFEEYFPYMGDEPYVHYYDSLTVEADSLKVYRLVAIERADMLYDRLQMIIRSDSLSVCDTVQVLDTASVVETVSEKDPEIVPKKDTEVSPAVQELQQKMQEMRNASPKRPVRAAIQKDSVEKRSNLKSSNNLWQLSE
jgi:hypothetical protein